MPVSKEIEDTVWIKLPRAIALKMLLLASEVGNYSEGAELSDEENAVLFTALRKVLPDGPIES
jgi:hypothetical protein